MLVGTFAAATLVVGISTAPMAQGPAPHALTLQQKNVATQIYVYAATHCVARAVAADTRFRKDNPALNIGDLIEDSMPKCIEPVRAMMAAFDLYFGDGMGEQYFAGPYLDALPSVVVKAIPDIAN